MQKEESRALTTCFDMHHHWGASGYCGELVAVSLRGSIRRGMPMSRLCHLLAEPPAICGSAKSQQVLLARGVTQVLSSDRGVQMIYRYLDCSFKQLLYGIQAEARSTPQCGLLTPETSLDAELRCRRPARSTRSTSERQFSRVQVVRVFGAFQA